MNSEEMEEVKRYFGVVAEGLRHDLQQVAEGHQVILGQVQEFREEVKEEFKEVRALMKFSFAELDHRIQSLESDVGGLKARLDRLEAQQR
jgi:ubiquinone biosynthesis protein UbiJ